MILVALQCVLKSDGVTLLTVLQYSVSYCDFFIFSLTRFSSFKSTKQFVEILMRVVLNLCKLRKLPSYNMELFSVRT